jgi:hypothetical protein
MRGSWGSPIQLTFCAICWLVTVRFTMLWSKPSSLPTHIYKSIPLHKSAMSTKLAEVGKTLFLSRIFYVADCGYRSSIIDLLEPWWDNKNSSLSSLLVHYCVALCVLQLYVNRFKSCRNVSVHVVWYLSQTPHTICNINSEKCQSAPCWQSLFLDLRLILRLLVYGVQGTMCGHSWTTVGLIETTGQQRQHCVNDFPWSFPLLWPWVGITTRQKPVKFRLGE